MSQAEPQSTAASGLRPAAERLAILALGSSAFVMTLNANVMAVLMPYLADTAMMSERGVDDFGTLAGSAGLAGALGALLLGPLVDHYGRRPPMLIGMWVFSLASFAHVFAADFGMLLAARATAGFAAGVVYTSASAAVADLVPYARRGRAMGLFTACMFLSLPVGLPLAGMFAELGHWEWIYLLQGSVGLLAVFAIRRFFPSGAGRGSAFLANLPRLATVEVFGALASVLLYVGSFFTAVQFAGVWLDDSGLVAKRDQWQVWVVLGLCSAVGSLLLSRIADRIGKRLWTNLTCLVVAACLFGLTFVDGPVGLLLVGVPLSMVSAARTGPFQALISDLVPQDCRGTLMGVRSAAVNLGTGLFPLLAVQFARGVGTEGYHDVLMVSSVGVLCAMILVIALVKKR